MCEPTTIAAVSSWASANAGAIALAGAVATTGGVVMQAQAAKNQAAYAQRVAQNNAAEAERAAVKATDKGATDAMAIRRQAAQIKGGQRAALAARGLDLNSGTAEQLQAQTDFFADTDMATVRQNAAETARGYRAQGANFSAAAANSSPGSAFGTSLLSGAGSVADKWRTFAQA